MFLIKAGIVLSIQNASAENFKKLELHSKSDEEDELDYIQNGASDITEGLELDADEYENSDE